MSFIFTETTPKDNYNRPLYGFHGQYTLSQGVSLPYFLASMPIERVIDELKIAEQVAPSIENRWSLNELFQREVDRDRVARDLVRGYLADPNKLKFFNALTIVLMPKTQSASGIDQFDSDDGDGPTIPWDGSDKDDKQWHDAPTTIKASFGGVQYHVVGAQARLRWDLDRVLAVAVDGQHRLVALQEFRDTYRQKALSMEEKRTTIPILFLLITPKAGFLNTKAITQQGVRSIARELFTDLNKNAKTVDTARQLVLDDWDLTARCVRDLVTDEAARDSSEVLPLTLVRWQEAINRFDTSYYLNSLVHLQMLVDDVLSLPTLKSMDARSVEDYIKQVGSALGENGHLVDPATKRDLQDVYKQDYCDTEEVPQTPFTRLPSTYLELAIQGFRKNHRGWMIRLLTEFAPYKQLLTYARANNLIEGEFGKWHTQTKKHRNILKEEFNSKDTNWYNREILSHISAIEALKFDKDDSDWSFKAIVQKAFVRLAKTIVFDQASDKNRLGDLDSFLDFFNALHAHGVLRVHAPLKEHAFGLWTYIATNPGNHKIKVTAKVEENILAVLRLWYYADRKLVAELKAPEGTAKGATDSGKILAYFEAKKNFPIWPQIELAIPHLRAVFSNQGLYKTVGLSDTAETEEGKQKLNAAREDVVTKRLAAVIGAGMVR